jgi:hypothetical protein
MSSLPRQNMLSQLIFLVGAVSLALTSYFLWTGYASRDTTVSVAFIGNSFIFVNDMPRVLEAFSEGKMKQDSLLHGSLNLVSLTKKGNGMYRRWGKSSNAINEDGFHDFGACTVIQLLQGRDEWLDNYKDYYYDDGLNPCFEDPSYLEYASMIRAPEGNADKDSYPTWNFVVFNDQSMRPTDYKNNRILSAYALKNVYAPLMKKAQSIPILFMTWAYWRDETDMSVFVDIPTFTSLLYEGYQDYAQVLEASLPSEFQPRIAPVGLAFLVVWEENPSFWKRLFGQDNFHPSPHGTFLASNVIFCTIHKRLPPASTRFTESVFSRSRGMQISGSSQPLPTEEEAIYLRWIAKRVALDGYIPKSLSMNGG